MRAPFHTLKHSGPSCFIVHLVKQSMAARGETVDEKIRKLDVELGKYRDQLRKARPGPAQEAVKRRAMLVLKQKRM